jgi:hypothetical protein
MLQLKHKSRYRRRGRSAGIEITVRTAEQLLYKSRCALQSNWCRNCGAQRASKSLLKPTSKGHAIHSTCASCYHSTTPRFDIRQYQRAIYNRLKISTIMRKHQCRTKCRQLPLSLSLSDLLGDIPIDLASLWTLN